MLVFHDFLCGCGNLTEVAFGSHDAIKREVPCPECDGYAVQYYGSRRDFASITRWKWDKTAPGSYGSPGLNYGTVDPQTGLVYENYSDKKRKLKALGMEEAGDLVGGTRTDFSDPQEGRDTTRPDNVITADSVEEITGLIDQDQVDRRATGENDKRPMLESWVGL